MSGYRAVAVLLAMTFGCAAMIPVRAEDQPPTKVREVPLKSSKGTSATMRSALYDGTTGLCTAGSLQLMTKADIDGRKLAWKEKPLETGCRAPAKKKVRARALYPVDDKGRRAKGAAHLLLELDRDGSIAEVQAVCATSEAFARAAAATAARLAFSPGTCDGQPVRSVILLPIAFDL